MNTELMETVTTDEDLLAIGMAMVYVEAQKAGWNCYVAFGKFSVTQPDVMKTVKGTEYCQVWQTEPYQQNGVSACLAIGTNKDGNHVFAKKADGKLWRKRVAGLNAYNIALTKGLKLVKYESGYVPKQATASFDNEF